MYDLLAGNWELAVGDTLIPAALLGDLSPNYEEGEVSAETQAGTITTPSGKPDTSEFTFTLYLPKTNAQKYLGIIFPGLYNEPSGTQKSGNLEFGSSSCTAREPIAMNVHDLCATTDDNDFFIPAGIPKITFNPTLATADAVSVEITVYMQPDEEGLRFRFGTGDLTQPSYYDVATQTTKPVEAS